MARPAPRLFVQGPLTGGTVALAKEQAHYLGTVLRLGEGASVSLFDGASGEWSGRLDEVTRRGAVVTLAERSREQAFGPDLTLLFAPLKKGPTDLVVRMGTELGVRRFVPVVTARTQAERVRTDRLAVIATEAAEQCERLDVPRVDEPVPLATALGGTGDLLFCDEAGAAADGAWGREALPPVPSALAGRGAGAWSVLIGPEGGFADEEREAIRARPGTVRASLGPRVLKAETATVAALTLWGAALGDL